MCSLPGWIATVVTLYSMIKKSYAVQKHQAMSWLTGIRSLTHYAHNMRRCSDVWDAVDKHPCSRHEATDHG